MISPNDSSILAALSIYPDMDRAEVDTYINRLNHSGLATIAYAIAGVIRPDDLDEETRQSYDDFMEWSRERRQSVRNEEVSARYREKETRLANRMIELHEKGAIPEETLFLYGISGDLPDREEYIRMTEEEKENFWDQKFIRRFGENWRTRLNVSPEFLKETCERITHNWLSEGF